MHVYVTCFSYELATLKLNTIYGMAASHVLLFDHYDYDYDYDYH